MGRIFKNMKEAINEIERDISEMGIMVHPHSMQNKNVKDDPNFDTMEVQNYTFTILDTRDKDKCVDHLKWCELEFEERINTINFENPGAAWLLRKETWEPFLVDGKMDYTYNERINLVGQLSAVIKELRENPDTRQAVIHVNIPGDSLFWRQKRIPCSMYYQFMIRRGKLDIIYNMRSSDFDTHFKNDIWLAAELRDYIAMCIDVPTGLFHMNVGSLHRYRNYTKKHVF
jgi:thymidylate synthase